MLRSLQSTQRERFSEPITRMRRAPVSSSPWATRTAYMKPLHAAFTSIAAQFKPSSFATIGAEAGHSRSGVVVARTKKSMSPTSSPASAMAFRPAMTPSETAEPPIRRSRMPVRSVIHSSEVSSVRESSSLVTMRSGRAMPQPLKRTPIGQLLRWIAFGKSRSQTFGAGGAFSTCRVQRATHIWRPVSSVRSIAHT